MDKKVTKKELAADIIKLARRNLATEYRFLGSAIYMLEPYSTPQIESVCSNYKYLFYNENYIINNYRKNFQQIKLGILHCVLHCLLLHQSLNFEDQQLVDAAADMAVLDMMRASNDLDYTASAAINKFFENIGSRTTANIYRSALNNDSIKIELLELTRKNKYDEHSLWNFVLDATKMQNIPGGKQNSNNIQSEEHNQNSAQLFDTNQEICTKQQEWSEQLLLSVESSRNDTFGFMHGNMFAGLIHTDRFSKFSYKDYIRRFANSEILNEDMDTINYMMYTLGMDLYGDMPIIEFNEVKEFGCMTNVIVAIDMSGSCSGDIAVDFARQIHTLFAECNISSRVNIKVITFDTEIMDEFNINSQSDADKLIKEYTPHGFGGTNFNCIFDYAANFTARNKLKALFVFSDGCGLFPLFQPPYKTVFFVPDPPNQNYTPYDNVPGWVELVHYRD